LLNARARVLRSGVSSSPEGAEYPAGGLVVRTPSVGGAEKGAYSSYSLAPPSAPASRPLALLGWSKPPGVRQELVKSSRLLQTQGSICVHEGEPLFHVEASRVGPPSWRRSDSRVDERQACRPSRCNVPSTRRLAAAPSLRWGFLISQLEYVLGGGGLP
jgi:hypothetical protein